VVEATTRTLQLAARNGIAIEGAVTWTFEFEGERFFAGYRELATNGIAKPVLNAFRMLGMLKGERLMATSSAALSLNAILDRGVAGAPDIDCIATRDDNGIHVLVWNYHDDDLPEMGEVPVALEIGGLRSGACIARHYRMDGEHSNAHAAFRAMGAPRRPTRAQYSELEAASRLACLREPTPLVSDGGTLRFDFSLPRHAVSLISLSSA
jgi:xylan 1,4-beta-xylosidase